MMLDLIQPHTIQIYDLANRSYVRERVKARSLLSVTRFDLFAKLYYARLREAEPEKALDMYVQHIKAFNPDLREPGRDDKVTLESFVSTYNHLLDYFKDNDFDDSLSLVPVDEQGVILDGAHRVAALAYYDKEVTILRFEGVHSKGPFDYQYFKDRGLSWKLCDLIANEIPLWRDDILIACLWPQMGDENCKDQGTAFLSNHYPICYIKDMKLSLKSITPLVAKVYAAQPWVSNPAALADKSINCYGNTSKIARFVLIQSSVSLEETIANKEALREIFHSGKHSIHITDNVEETRDLLPLICTPEGEASWNVTSSTDKLLDGLNERWYYFKKVQFINLKVRVASIISKLLRR